MCILTFALSHADVAELVDAQVSEACELKLVEVRFFSSALFFTKKRREISMKSHAFFLFFNFIS